MSSELRCMNRILLLILLSCAPLLWAQQPSNEVIGKISADLYDKSGIYIINQRTEQSVMSDHLGNFQISAIAGDSLMFSSTETIGHRIVLTDDDLSNEILFVKLEVLVNRLDEVIIYKRSNITSESLGLISKNQKKYTPAERKLNTASNPYEVVGLRASASLDPVLNWMSGRTAMLKKEVEVEKKEGWLAILSDMYDEKHIVEILKVPAEYVNGFLRYCIENDSFIQSLMANNKGITTFQLTGLAVEYNKIIKSENP